MDESPVTTWEAKRRCVVCHQNFAPPLTDGWTTVRIGDGQYWRCPSCSAEPA